MADLSRERDSLVNAIESRFTRTNDGMIVDTFGKRWLLWDAEMLAAWWRKLGDLTDRPLGRRLAFAALECEKSMLLEQLPRFWFRHKKRSWQSIAIRWSEMGWGRFQFSEDRIVIENPVNDALSSGLICAAAESIRGDSFRLRWEGGDSKLVHVILSKDSREIPNPSSLPNVIQGDQPFIIEISATNEGIWEIDGRRSLLLPFDLFTELGKSSDCIEQQSSAMFEVFKELDEHIILGDDWTALFENYLYPMGLRTPQFVFQKGMISSFTLPAGEYFTEGILLACWERSFGRPSVQNRDESGNFVISPKHEIASVE